ncbi:MAG: hypothetical protein WD766_02870 [Gemmatimonadota bacterium]
MENERNDHEPRAWADARDEEEAAIAPAEGEDDERGGDRAPGAIRAEDIEPYFALQYVARLFKIAAMVVIVALTAEVIAGIALEGAGAILPLFAEVIRGVVLAAILWGVGDLTVLFIDVGHDVRAARVLLGRLSARANADSGGAPADEMPID